MYVCLKLIFQTQVEEGQEHLVQRQEVSAINVLFRGGLFEFQLKGLAQNRAKRGFG